MESLQNWGFMGDIRINSGFYWGNKTGIYYDILGRVCSRLAAGVSLCKALGARLPSGGVPFLLRKVVKEFLGQDCSRLTAGR